MKVKVNLPFRDIECGVQRKPGDTFECSQERFDFIENAIPGYVEPIEQEETPAVEETPAEVEETPAEVEETPAEVEEPAKKPRKSKKE